MLSREEEVARRLEADKQSLAVLFGWLDDEILEDDDALDEGSERELVDAERTSREMTPENLLLGTM